MRLTHRILLTASKGAQQQFRLHGKIPRRAQHAPGMLSLLHAPPNFTIILTSYCSQQHLLKFLDRESVDLFHGDTYKASEVA
jgi:hypothetical protein